MKIRTFSR